MDAYNQIWENSGEDEVPWLSSLKIPKNSREDELRGITIFVLR
jgi:hypothetical protein